ncbi:MAG: NnrU family protein [Steroidobacteraceae bacterium]
MLNLCAASLFFLLIHFGVSGTRLRDALVARLGDGPYRGLFSLASLAGLVWLIHAYRHAPAVPTWGLLLALRPAAYVLVFVAFLFVVIGAATPNPTSVGMEAKLAQGPDAARGMLRITRHPFLCGVALWALAHLLVNGHLAALVLFGSLLVLAIGGTASIDAKRRRGTGAQWTAFAGVTSVLPFAAIAAGRNRLGPALREIGPWRPLVAVLVYAAVFHLHGWLGAPLVG